DPSLDERLRTHRLRVEARLISTARSMGVLVPLIYDVDAERNMLVLEFVHGTRVKDAIEALEGERLASLCTEIGRIAGRMHAGGIVHGDLTTSNMILTPQGIYLIDFSLGEFTTENEARGVDLHLLKEALASAHSARPEAFRHVLAGYREVFSQAREVEKVMSAIEKRGRYT
ncbi:MAG: KEOPS complex kinase/ATPase Bud32, partial [Candidatus Thermoplasmatota archaeon]